MLRALPGTTKPMDALRTAVSAWGATQDLPWPPTVEQARALTAFAPSALAAFARLRSGQEPVEPDPSLDLVPGFLYQLTGSRPDEGTARALDAYFIVGVGARVQRLDVHGAGHHLDAVGHRLGRGRGDRDDEGAAPRRRAVGGRGPAGRGGLRRSRRAWVREALPRASG